MNIPAGQNTGKGIKVVYYGPASSGKTTNVQVLHQNAPPGRKAGMMALATATDRNAFFDFLTLEMGEICGCKIHLQIYTVPGLPSYYTTRKLLLRGADAVIFVADAAAPLDQNRDSWVELQRNIGELGISRDLPVVVQWNKAGRNAGPRLTEFTQSLNLSRGLTVKPAQAINGTGVFETLQAAMDLFFSLDKTVQNQ